MSKLLFVQRPEDHSKNSCCIYKQKYYQGDKISVAYIHLSNLHPTIANKTAITKVKDTTKILPKSSCRPVKRVTAPIPKNTWEEAIQKFDQYLFSSPKPFDFIQATLTKISNFINDQIDLRIYNYALTATQMRTLMNDGAARFVPSTGSP